MKIQDLRRAVAGALALEELQTVFGGRKTTIVLPADRYSSSSDRCVTLTPLLDLEAVLDPALAALRAVGARCTVVAPRRQYAPSRASLDAIQTIVSKHESRVVYHDPDDSQGPLTTVHSDVRTPEARRAGVASMPARFHPAVTDAEALLAIGLVEPDPYAGFSGGAEVIGLDCAAGQTIQALRGFAFLRSPDVRLGHVTGNPFQGALWRLIRDLPPQRGLMIVPPVGRESWSAFAGPLSYSFNRAVNLGSDRLFSVVDAPRPWVHLSMLEGVGFYEASRAFVALALAPNTALAPGGPVVLQMASNQNLDASSFAFVETIRRGPEALRAVFTSGAEDVSEGAHQAFLLSRALERARLVVLGALPIPELAEFGVQSFADLAAARSALGLKGRMPKLDNVLHSVPVLAKPS
ncbi:MAG: hypothetical protein AAF449_01625 [Myxococcota bacterium]